MSKVLLASCRKTACRICFLIALLGWSEAIPAQEMPTWLAEAYAVKIPEVDLDPEGGEISNLRSPKGSGLTIGRRTGLGGKKHPSVRYNPQLKSHSGIRGICRWSERNARRDPSWASAAAVTGR